MNHRKKIRIGLIATAFIMLSLFNIHLGFDSGNSFESVSFRPTNAVSSPITDWTCTGSTCPSVPGGFGWKSTGVDGRLNIVCCMNANTFPGSRSAN